MSASTIVIMAGGTGGHVFPAQAVAEALEGRRLLWIGGGGLEVEAAEDVGAEFIAIEFSSPRRLRRLLAWLLQLLRCWCQLNALFAERRPALVIGFGSYLSVPGALVALWRRIPVVIHEQNSRAGLANRLLALWARRIFTAYPEPFAKRSQTVLLGNPLRRSHGDRPRPPRSYAGRASDSHWRLLALGGSQGATTINKIVPEAIAALLSRQGEMPLRVRHLCGLGRRDDTRGRYADLGIDSEIKSYSNEIHEEYAWADIAVCRAGALTLSELAHHALPAIIVPLPHATDDHQSANAGHYAQNEAARVIADSPGAAPALAQCLESLLADASTLERMSAAMHRAARMGVAEKFAQLALECQALPAPSQ